jgi:hypothetical protein
VRRCPDSLLGGAALLGNPSDLRATLFVGSTG